LQLLAPRGEYSVERNSCRHHVLQVVAALDQGGNLDHVRRRVELLAKKDEARETMASLGFSLFLLSKGKRLRQDYSRAMLDDPDWEHSADFLEFASTLKLGARDRETKRTRRARKQHG